MRYIKYVVLSFLILSVSFYFSYSKEKEGLDIKMKAHLITFEKKGDEFVVVKKKLPKEVKPEDIIEYQIVVYNPTEKRFKNVFIKSPIPKGTEFIENSESPGALFSIDNGKTYEKPPVKYKVKENGKVVEKIATPDMYTHIGWNIKEIKPKEKIKLFYWVKVKK